MPPRNVRQCGWLVLCAVCWRVSNFQLLPTGLLAAPGLPSRKVWQLSWPQQPLLLRCLRCRVQLRCWLQQRHAGTLPCGQFLPPRQWGLATACVPCRSVLWPGFIQSRALSLRALLLGWHKQSYTVSSWFFLPNKLLHAIDMLCRISMSLGYMQRDSACVQRRLILPQRERSWSKLPRGFLLPPRIADCDSLSQGFILSCWFLVAAALPSHLLLCRRRCQLHLHALPTRHVLLGAV